MTAADLDELLDRVLAFDLEMRRAAPTSRPPASFDAEDHRSLNREHELACEAMRAHPTAEGRTFFRLEVLRLEKLLSPMKRTA